MENRKKTDISQFEKMTKTPVPKLVVMLSVPSIISMLITNVYNLADTAFVGQLGTSASGAVGIVFGFMSIIQAFGFMFGQGSGSLLARALGRRDNDAASVYASAGFFLSFLSGAVITLIGFLFLDRIVLLLGSTQTILPYAKTYIFYILIASPFMCSSFTMNNILRYEGKASLGMIGLLTGAVMNMIGDPIFMFACNMGIAGAGLSTALSQGISFMILIFMFISGKTETKITFKNLQWVRLRMIGDIMATGFPSLIRQGLNSITTVMLNTQCAVYGDAAVAAMSIISRIIFFTFSIALGTGQGFQPVAAFNYGARKYSRLRQAFKFTVALSEIIIVIGCIFLLIFPEQLISLFRNDPDVIAIGTRALRLQAIATLVLPVCMATEMLHQSTGKRLAATLISALRNGILFIPALLVLSQTRGIAGIQEAQPLSLLISLPITVAFMLVFFKKLPRKDGDI